MYLTATFSPDGTYLVVVSYGRTSGETIGDGPLVLVHEPALAIVWKTSEWAEEARCKGDHRDDLSFHPEGRLFSFAGKLWDVASGEITREIEGACWLSFSPDGKLLVGLATEAIQDSESDEDSEDDEDDMPVWAGLLLNSETGEALYRLPKENDDREIIKLRFVEGGARVAAMSYSYDYSDRMYFWDTNSGLQLPTFDRVDEQVEVVGNFWDVALEVAPSGRYIITRQGEVQLWELTECEWLHRYTCRGHAYGVWNAFFSADEAQLVTMGAEALPHEGDDGMAFSVRIWDVDLGREQSVFMVSGKCFGCALSPDGSLLAAMSAETKDYFRDEADAYVLTIWDVPSGQMRTQRTTGSKKTNLLYHHPTDLTFSPDGRLLAVSHLRHVEVWDVQSILEGSHGSP
jgi:WD40 repeat protein